MTQMDGEPASMITPVTITQAEFWEALPYNIEIDMKYYIPYSGPTYDDPVSTVYLLIEDL